MVKINPILKVKFSDTPNIAKQLIEDEVKVPNIKFEHMTRPFADIIPQISTFLHDFNRTVIDENYFQLKVNPETGKPYQPDVFQKSSAMNLYLGNDVLVTAPTGTGKTAIAEYIITKNLNEGNKTFYTTPLKALSNEKFRDFCKIYGKGNVGLITGDEKENTDAPIIVMTTEVYRNMAVTQKFNFDKSSDKGVSADLKTVIFDELQYLGDADRGGVWEQAIMFTPKNVQILSLSATIGNNEEINDWIASTKGRRGISVTPQENYLPEKSIEKETVLINVPPENRHVPLTLSILSVDSDILTPDRRAKRFQTRSKHSLNLRSESIAAKPEKEVYKYLTQSLYGGDKLPAIYFILSKKEGRETVKYLAEEGIDLNDYAEKAQIKDIIESYKKQGIYLGESLNISALYKGYAMHNAGMLPSQKQLIEELCQKKLVKVIIATETLAAGINMPARTTVITHPQKPSSTSSFGLNRVFFSPNEAHQIWGRAGRRGIDTHGYGYALSCNLEQTKHYNEIMRTPSNPIQSKLDLDYSFIANYAAEFYDETELENILAKSLYVYRPDGRIDIDKLFDLMKKYRIRKDILTDNNYMDSDGKLLLKGKMLKSLNGYEQIPIINIISNSYLENLTLPQLAGIIGGLANIEINAKFDIIPESMYDEKPYGICDIPYLEEFENARQELKKHEREIFDLFPEKTLHIDKNIADHVYKWVQLNEKNDNGRENWRELYRGEFQDTIRDEGGLFDEISAAADLIKQLRNACRTGIREAKTTEERGHYKNLTAKFNKLLKLIQREPFADIRT